MILYIYNKNNKENFLISINNLPETRPIVGIKTAINSLIFLDEFNSTNLEIFLLSPNMLNLELVEARINTILQLGISRNELINLIMEIIKVDVKR